MQRITIPVEVTPDICFVREVGQSLGSSTPEYNRFAFIFNHNMVMVIECTADGAVKSYYNPKYYGCRLINGRVEILDARDGWRVDNHATRIYAEEKAEEELLK